ncbi:DUF7133 domain-containing protein [Rubritalea marina]|uniref:DUF7133 domain-containing protein n=1 Tax=Rubritalea marina TaxID=361055 RepID=UPI0003674B03|nr:hypothetical protein [Rubritalea marina]
MATNHHKYTPLASLFFTGLAVSSLFADEDPYKKSGNIDPEPHRLSPADETELLKDISVPEGFTPTLFSPWQMANYPAYISASPEGDLYVSSDGNASIGRDAERGRIIKLVDEDQDGRADKVTKFVDNIDSPRGVLWDLDTLYVLHPPHITAYKDTTGDGVADESKRLISNIAFGFKDRSADHTTNGLDIGADGWIYISVGDFGFMEASGTDGRKIQLRGGGVVRFRPDGSGIEVFSYNTRNIYGVAITPTLDLFSRDNTNDGGGWNVRFHHHTGLEDHGYPRHYINFPDEIVAPLADYGGGSGVGAFYLDEPGVPAAWNKFPYTLDWGRQGSFKHTVEAQGATFKEAKDPEIFIKMTRPTEATIDGLSGIYQASWKGPASYGYKGVNHGYIAKVVPTGFTPEPLPNFAELDDLALVELIKSSPSHTRRLTAQRHLVSRKMQPATTAALTQLCQDQSLELGHRVLALYAITQHGIDSKNSQSVIDTVIGLASPEDPLTPFITRAMGDMGLDRITSGLPGSAPVDFLKAQFSSAQSRNVLEAIIAATRQQQRSLSPEIAKQLGHSDPIIAHTAYRALAQMQASEAALAHLNSTDLSTRTHASWALMRIHTKENVEALSAMLTQQKDLNIRQSILSSLARLYHQDATWKGDSWGTRPDTRGPYYEPTTWEQSDPILKTLNAIIHNDATPASESAHVIALIGKNRIKNDAALDRILVLAEQNQALIPTVINQLAEAKDIPEKAIPMIYKAAQNPKTTRYDLKPTVEILFKTKDPEVYPNLLAALSNMQQAPNSIETSKIRDAFVNWNQLENFVQDFENTFINKPNTNEGIWAAKALLKMAEGKGVGPEAVVQSRNLIDKYWPNKAHKITLLNAAFWARVPYINERVRLAAQDPDQQIAGAAKGAMRRLRIQPLGADKTPKIGSISAEEAIAQAIAYKQGNIALGEAVFNRASCNSCHTSRADEAPKGPYLGSIASILTREQLAEAIIQPNKTIAQGFKTNYITLNDGSSLMGFVTDESSDSVSLRDITSKEHTFAKDQIKERSTLPNSLMPPGLMNASSVHEFASLLDYLEKIALSH